MDRTIRRLRADEVELRAAQCGMTRTNKPYATLLIYKDARVDQRILDETFGPMNWERSHEVIAGRLYCTVRIWDAEKGQWVSKQDVGTESNTEKEKGLASDSFKRACVNWGIGRELYTSPFIWIKPDSIQLKKNDRTGKIATYDKFSVEKITYDEKRNIVGLAIRNTTMNKRAFVWMAGKQENA
jgi:hypothetical protein